VRCFIIPAVIDNNLIPFTLGHGKDVSEGPASSMFSAENTVDEINGLLKNCYLFTYYIASHHR